MYHFACKLLFTYKVATSYTESRKRGKNQNLKMTRQRGENIAGWEQASHCPPKSSTPSSGGILQ
jgi:hypothetical protein